MASAIRLDRGLVADVDPIDTRGGGRKAPVGVDWHESGTLILIPETGRRHRRARRSSRTTVRDGQERSLRIMAQLRRSRFPRSQPQETMRVFWFWRRFREKAETAC